MLLIDGLSTPFYLKGVSQIISSTMQALPPPLRFLRDEGHNNIIIIIIIRV